MGLIQVTWSISLERAPSSASSSSSLSQAPSSAVSISSCDTGKGRRCIFTRYESASSVPSAGTGNLTTQGQCRDRQLFSRVLLFHAREGLCVNHFFGKARSRIFPLPAAGVISFPERASCEPSRKQGGTAPFRGLPRFLPPSAARRTPQVLRPASGWHRRRARPGQPRRGIQRQCSRQTRPRRRGR